MPTSKNKCARLEQLRRPGFEFEKLDVADGPAIEGLFARHRFDRVVHLAAQAGVRYSLTKPHEYVRSNLTGFLNLLEACRHHAVQHLVYASSSSVYGGNTRLPFAESDNVDHPVSLYAASKKAGEVLAHAYHYLHGLDISILRYFTVYGPAGRPDLAMFRFCQWIHEGRRVRVNGTGEQSGGSSSTRSTASPTRLTS